MVRAHVQFEVQTVKRLSKILRKPAKLEQEYCAEGALVSET